LSPQSLFSPFLSCVCSYASEVLLSSFCLVNLESLCLSGAASAVFTLPILFGR
jgi:hypothetical protein